MRRSIVLASFLVTSGWAAIALAEPVSSITQYGVTWTFDKEYESGQFATGDHWVVGPVNVVSVSPEPTGARHGSCVNPTPGKQGYDDRGGEFSQDDQVAFPHSFDADQSLVSSVSKPEGAEVKNAGSMVSQAVLTIVAAPQPEGTLRPAYAGTTKRYHRVADIDWTLLPKLPVPRGGGGGAQLLEMADRPRIDHLGSWTIQNSCAEENWNNGPGAHACYGREVGAYVSDAALHVLLDIPERDELALSMIQHGIDNYGVLEAGGGWAPNGGHHNGRKWPIVFAAAMLDDCDMKKVGADYDDSHFGEDGQTYAGANGEALFGWDCGGGHGTYFEDGCSGGGAKDCRDPAGLVDGCPDYRNCCTSSVWVGEALSTLILGAKGVWNHDPFFDYVDRWMTGEVDGGGDTDALSQVMWTTYRDDLPDGVISPECDPNSSGSGGSGNGAGGGSAAGGDGNGAGAPSGAGGDSSGAGAAAGADPDGASDGCGCRVVGTSGSGRALWLAPMALALLRQRRRAGSRRC